MFARHPHARKPTRNKQRGAALMVMLVIMIMGTAAFLVSSLKSSSLQIERDKKTADALAQAKDALIGFATKVTVTSNADLDTNTGNPCAITSNCPRPGDLPCPDLDNDGNAEVSCGNAAGSNQYKRLGRLPWKTLDLPDLRDGNGERLWYAVSNNFKNNTRTTCNNANLAGCLNSDTPGTITVRTSDGSLLNDGGGNNGVVAIIFAPGEVLQRQGAASLQNRSCTVGVNCDAANKCTTNPPTLTPLCDPVNYLDNVAAEDNASFIDSSSINGFIQGRIKDNSGNVILNDQLLTITQDNIMQPVQKRVAAEVRNCLTEYAALPQNQGPLPNQGYYPWAAARTVNGGSVVYNDSDQLEFGHIPDQPFSQTCSDTGGNNCSASQNGGMKNSWVATCSINNSNWWVNWKEMVFYGLAYSLRPHDLTHNHVCPSATCLTVNPPSISNDKSFVVIVAGKKLSGQLRGSDAQKSTLSNYLEGDNATGATPFEQSPLSTIFNDIVVFQ